MQTFQAAYQDGLIIATIEGARWIVDTGSPASISDISQVNLDGVDIGVSERYLGMSISQLCDNMAIQADGLLGMDVFSKLDVTFDLPQGAIHFERGLSQPSQRMIELDSVFGVPILFLRLNGIEYRMLIDSGAEIGYLSAESVVGLKPSGMFTDMLPLQGMFETTTYELNTEINGFNFGILRYGEMPKMLEDIVAMANSDGILGNAVFKTVAITISLRQEGYWIDPA